MKQSIEGVRVFRDHSPECVMVPDNPLWLTDQDHTVIADRIGRERRRGTSFRWIVFACNDPDCLGEVWIRHDILTRFAGDLMAKAMETRKK